MGTLRARAQREERTEQRAATATEGGGVERAVVCCDAWRQTATGERWFSVPLVHSFLSLCLSDRPVPSPCCCCGSGLLRRRCDRLCWRFPFSRPAARPPPLHTSTRSDASRGRGRGRRRGRMGSSAWGRVCAQLRAVASSSRAASGRRRRCLCRGAFVPVFLRPSPHTRRRTAAVCASP